MSALKALVKYNYQADNSDELNLKVGDEIVDVGFVEPGWCQGNLNGQVGMFPDNFVELITVDEDPTKKEVIRTVRVTFDYDPSIADELKLSIGDIIEVYKDEEEGWARGCLNGKVGAFPTNFTETMATMTSPPPTSPKPATQTTTSPKPQQVGAGDNNNSASKKMKSMGGVGLGNIFGEGPIQLKTTDFGKSLKKKEESESKKRRSSSKSATSVVPTEEIKPEPASDKPKALRYEATWPYEALNADELTFKKGDIVWVDSKEGPDSGWWEGHIVHEDGSEESGVFPDNFVKEAPEEVKKEKPMSSPVDSKVKSKAEKKAEKASVSPAPVIQQQGSTKRQAPKVPPPPSQSSKPSLDFDDGESPKSEEETPEVEEEAPVPDEREKLKVYKRAAGPRNRKKPNANNRRSMAILADEKVEKEMETPPAATQAEEEITEAEQPTPTPPKPQMGFKLPMPVLPGNKSEVGGNTANEKPAWMKNLKSRKSEKRPDSMVVLPTTAGIHGDDDPPKPSWLTNLKKKKETIKSPPVKKEEAVKPSHDSKKAEVTSPTTNNMTSQQDAVKKVELRNHESFGTKKSQASTLPLNSRLSDFGGSTRKSGHIVGGGPPKPKPPPTTTKPVKVGKTPGVVASSNKSLEEVCGELKSLKDLVMKMQLEFKQSTQRLTSELETERRERISLQAELKKLKQVGN